MQYMWLANKAYEADAKVRLRDGNDDIINGVGMLHWEGANQLKSFISHALLGWPIQGMKNQIKA